MDRRSFVKKTSIGTAAMVSALPVHAFAKNQKLKIGLIGAGWYGMVDIRAALKTGGVEVIAVCDIDSEHLKTSGDELEKLQGTRPAAFNDYRDLLDVKKLRAVFLGTQPHWHALQFVAACEKGLDIYCEKPISYDVEEGKAMVEAQKKAGNIVQVGFQRRQHNSVKKVKELIQTGVLGKIHEIGAQIHYNPVLLDSTIQRAPASLDWETWCGPAPKLDYRPSIGHKAWRLEKEYGNGHLVDWGIHLIDKIRYIMDFRMPESFETTGALNILQGKITTPDTLRAVFNFEQCPVVWQHRMWGAGDLSAQTNNGVFFYGEKATLFTSDSKVIIMPAGKNQKQELLDIPTPGVGDKHVANFIDAVKAKDKKILSCTIEEGFLSAATVQLGMISYYTGSKVSWDTNTMNVVDNKAASELLARPYRGKYERPG